MKIMVRSLQEILDNAEALADQFEAMGEDDDIEVFDAAPIHRIQAAVRARAQAERELVESVKAARKEGLSWAIIGAYLGTSGEAARQRYSAALAGDALAPFRSRKKVTPRTPTQATAERVDLPQVAGANKPANRR